MTIKVMAVFGTRPEAIKMAPVIQEMRKYPGQFDVKVAVTAQHREMLDQVMRLFAIEPDYDLNLMQAGQTLEDITSRVLQGMAGVYRQEQPAMVLVHGDTTTTFAAALAAYYAQIPVGHVEAGLRTGNKYAPFPEEINRRLTGALAELHLAPTLQARENLLREGVAEKSIHVTGNTVVDALLATVREPCQFSDPALVSLDPNLRWLLVTAHRRENWGEPMEQTFLALKDLLGQFPDTGVLFPVHKNPRVRELAEYILGGIPRCLLVEPMDYLPFVHLMHRCYLVLTDSGGMQEEAPALGKPVLVLRDTTERPEAIAAGTVKLVGTSRRRVFEEAALLLRDKEAYARMATAVNPYGDGQAARRTAEALLYHFGRSASPPDPWLP
ncbi:MAG: non-hydrolyzing UDP-N-acetylglucosamine 2-epimerase [Bacillota bacterium]